MIKPIKLSNKKNGKGYVTSYSVNLGTAEIRNCGFIGADGNPMDLEKVIDTENRQIIIRVKKPPSRRSSAQS
jgi:hypothetical protein